jgi:hypothetical protein
MPPAASIARAAAPAPVESQLILLQPEGEILDLATFPGGVVAVGDRFVDIPFKGSRVDAMSWTSADGVRWVRSPSARSARDGNMLAVAVRGSTILAVGDDLASGGGAIWRSTDGLVWTRLATGTTFAAESIRDVIALPDGWLVATTHIRNPSDPTRREAVGGRLYGSTDGVHWTYRNGTSTLFKGAHIRSLARTSRGFVAVGGIGGTEVNGIGEFAVAFASADSLRWRVAWDLPAHRYSSAGDAVAVGDHTVAMGGVVQGGWVSSDDDRWQPFSDPDVALPAEELEGVRVSRQVPGADATSGANGVVVIRPVLHQDHRLEWSTDGVAWSAAPLVLRDGIPDLVSYVVLTVVRGPDGLIAAGALGGPMLPQSQPAVWLVPDPTAP